MYLSAEGEGARSEISSVVLQADLAMLDTIT